MEFHAPASCYAKLKRQAALLVTHISGGIVVNVYRHTCVRVVALRSLIDGRIPPAAFLLDRTQRTLNFGMHRRVSLQQQFTRVEHRVEVDQQLLFWLAS